MGRDVKKRTDYVSDSVFLYRLAQVVRTDANLSDYERETAYKLLHDTMDILRQVDARRTPPLRKGDSNVR
jgi:hypothetical protein